jgi:predicted MFS family arabinose efflux permease
LLWWGALSTAILAIVEGPQQGWGSPVVLFAGLLAVGLFVGFLKREDRSAAPLIEAETRADPRLRWGAATVSALFFGVMGTQFVVTQWLQGPQHKSALEAGLYFVPAAVASIVAAFSNPRLAHRFGHPAMAAVGLLLLAAGGAVATVGVVAENLPLVVVAALFVGSGIGFAAVSGVELIMSSARPERAGSASGVNETLVEASGALGIAVLGSVLVETGSYAWPLPWVALVALVTAGGVTQRLVRRARRRSPDAPTP